MSLEHAPERQAPERNGDRGGGDNGLNDIDLVWGAEAIGKEIGRTREQVYHLLKIGALDGAVRKVGFRTIVGSRRRLHELPLTPDAF